MSGGLAGLGKADDVAGGHVGIAAGEERVDIPHDAGGVLRAGLDVLVRLDSRPSGCRCRRHRDVVCLEIPAFTGEILAAGHMDTTHSHRKTGISLGLAGLNLGHLSVIAGNRLLNAIDHAQQLHPLNAGKQIGFVGVFLTDHADVQPAERITAPVFRIVFPTEPWYNKICRKS